MRTFQAVVTVAVAALMTGCNPAPNNGDDGGEGSGGGSGGGAGGAGGGGASGPVDLDVVVVRFNADGTLDQGFGSAGVSRTDVTTGVGTTRDNAYGMVRDASDRILVFGSARSTTRADADRVVMRFTADGALDTTFADQGKRWLDVGNVNDNPRHGLVQPDGKIVSSGYAALPTGVGTQAANSVVLQRLESDGALDMSFGVSGVVVSNPFKPADPVNTQWGMAEAYGAALQNGKYVTAGYGRAAPSGAVNMVSFRYLADGTLDSTWGTNGIVELDLVGADERGRNLVAHADGRVFVVGSGTPTTGNVDAMITALTPAGALDTSFNPMGYRLFAFGRSDEAFFGAAISPTGSVLAAVGHAAGQGDADDDALLALIPIATGAPAEVAKIVALSDTGHDRLVSVTFDAQGKVIASGLVVENGDSRVVVARFNPDGSFDATFGTGGQVSFNVAAGKADEIARSVAVQSSGKIVIAGVADH